MADMISKFVASVSSGIAPLTVNFTNTSSGNFVSVKWDFGDGTTSSQINPTHKYTTNGSFKVTLTTYDESGLSATYSSVIVVYAETDLTVQAAELQQTLSHFKRFDSSQVSVRASKQTGTVFQTSYPMTSTTAMSTASFCVPIKRSCLSAATAVSLVYSGGDEEALHVFVTGNGIYSSACYVALILNATAQTALHTDKWWNYYSGNALDFHQTLFYNVVGMSAGPTIGTITVDRPLPFFSGGGLGTGLTLAQVFLTSSGTTTSANTYYSNYNQSLRSKQAIDSYDYMESVGVFSASTDGKGLLNFYGYDDGTGRTITAIYPYYSGYNSADAWYPGTIRLHLPTVMWHNSSTPGLTLTDTVDSTMRDEVSELRYRYLRDGSTTSSNIIGKVFYDKKMIIIHDQEVNAALQFNSNRSYTLPPLNYTYQILSNYTSDFQTGTAYYVTYAISGQSGPSTGATGGFGTGHLIPVHCRYIQRIVPSLSGGALAVQPTVSLTPWYASSAGGGTGFTVGGNYLIIGTGSSETNVPNYNSFKYSAVGATYHVFSSSFKTVPNYSAFTNAYNFTDKYLSGNSNLHFGKEILGIGYLSGNLETTIYKLAASCVAKNNEFNTTQNTTFDSTVNDSVYVSEVAAYNENNDLLLIGKLNTPIEKNNQKYVTIKLELDF